MPWDISSARVITAATEDEVARAWHGRAIPADIRGYAFRMSLATEAG